jgi:hypothetical protein
MYFGPTTTEEISSEISRDVSSRFVVKYNIRLIINYPAAEVF